MKPLIIIVTIIFSFYAMPAIAGIDENITVKSIKGCDKELPWGKSARVKSTKWKGNKFIIKIIQNQGCGPLSPVEPSYIKTGNTLILNWRWHLPPGSPIAGCLCTRHLEFTITNLPKNQYKIQISKEIQKQ
jgi:hypothetical protein